MSKHQVHKTILIADDEFALVNTLDMFLTARGYRVATAYTGATALAHVTTIVPDLVLLDVMMPYMGGLEILEKMRASSQLKHIPVILMGEVAPLVPRTWNLYIGKPFQFGQLHEGIVQLIGTAPSR